jgi:hypothetical protein
MEAFIILNFLNNYQYWRLRYNLELIHPNIAIQKKQKCMSYRPLKRVRPTKVGPWPPSSGRKVEGKLLFINWVERVGAAHNHHGTHAMVDLIWRALQTDYSIQADNLEVENLVTRRSVAWESKADINWDAAIGFNLFGANEANDCANPTGNEAHEHQEKDSDHSGSSEENKQTFQSDEDEDA